MTTATLEKKLKPFEAPVSSEILKWLYIHLPPQPIKNRRMHRGYSDAIRTLMEEMGQLSPDQQEAISQYLNSVIPFIDLYEKKEFPISAATPEEVFKFLLDQNNLSQYDVAKEVGGQPVVSEILRGKRRLTREHIERLSKRFGVTPATFYPGSPSA